MLLVAVLSSAQILEEKRMDRKTGGKVSTEKALFIFDSMTETEIRDIFLANPMSDHINCLNRSIRYITGHSTLLAVKNIQD